MYVYIINLVTDFSEVYKLRPKKGKEKKYIFFFLKINDYV